MADPSIVDKTTSALLSSWPSTTIPHTPTASSSVVVYDVSSNPINTSMRWERGRERERERERECVCVCVCVCVRERKREAGRRM